MENKTYESPAIKMVPFEIEDILTTSSTETGGGNNGGVNLPFHPWED